TTSIGDPIPSFRDLRAPARYMTWQARALALEGRGDEALAEVATLLAVSQKLTPESRTLVRGMIAVVMQKMALQTADFVLTTTETSTESRTHLLAVVTARQNPADAARLLVWSDYPISANGLLSMGAQMDANSLEGQWPYAHRVFFNPRATANLLGDYFNTLSHHASARNFDAMKMQENVAYDRARAWRLKNLSGHLFLAMAAPAFSKITESHW